MIDTRPYRKHGSENLAVRTVTKPRTLMNLFLIYARALRVGGRLGHGYDTIAVATRVLYNNHRTPHANTIIVFSREHLD